MNSTGLQIIFALIFLLNVSNGISPQRYKRFAEPLFRNRFRPGNRRFLDTSGEENNRNNVGTGGTGGENGGGLFGGNGNGQGNGETGSGGGGGFFGNWGKGNGQAGENGGIGSGQDEEFFGNGSNGNVQSGVNGGIGSGQDGGFFGNGGNGNGQGSVNGGVGNGQGGGFGRNFFRTKRNSHANEREDFYKTWNFDSRFKNVNGNTESDFLGYFASNNNPDGNYYHFKNGNPAVPNTQPTNSNGFITGGGFSKGFGWSFSESNFEQGPTDALDDLVPEVEVFNPVTQRPLVPPVTPV